ncbi:MAG: hypothetical protein EF813_11865 [Methanosarcinales archaeon]|nr:MAG: hypothetical protein EF813_11865 [Methanosarcinales archaeon]
MKNKVVLVGFLAVLVMSAMAMPSSARVGDVLVGWAVLPANTTAAGPTSGQFIGEEPINGVFPPFVEEQPVQGF